MQKDFSGTKQGGFVLVNALMILTLLLSVSALVFYITTKDLRISTRIAGEKRAFVATESGINNLLFQTDQLKLSGLLTQQSFQSITEPPLARFAFSVPGTPVVPNNTACRPIVQGNSAEEDSGKFGYAFAGSKRVRGGDANYNTAVQIEVGVEYYTSCQ